MGAFVWWYPNGQQKIGGEYQHDLETGVWNWWHANGMREARGQYASGQKTEEWSVWDASGKLVRRDSTHGEVESRTAKLDLLGSAIDK